MKLLHKLRVFLEKIDRYRDRALFVFIKPYWPRKITPNQITYFRVFLGLLLFVLLFFLNIENRVLVIFLFSVAAITDLLDGSVARCLKKETEFGAMLDPIADRILIIPIAVYSLYKSAKWLLLFLLLAEVLNGVAAVFYKSKEVYKANIFGKTRMVLISVVFIAILVVWPASPPLFFLDLLWISLIFTVLSIFTRIIDLSGKGFIKNKIIRKECKKIQKNENL